MLLTLVKRKLVTKAALVFLLCLFQPRVSNAYSVLAHEALIDAVWDHYFVPRLKAKYPSLNDSLLREAHGYAYGGAVAPDMGYYPFGSKLFTNLIHYVRSGDFITALLHEAKTPNEYAFALGSLCHYYADIYGHRMGVNPAVPLQYPKDQKFGNTVTFYQDEVAHKRVEFAFDVSQTAKGNFAPRSYHDFIGFKIADSVLERAFYKTYQLHLTDVFKNFSRAVGTFRWTVKNFFPVLTKAAWATKGAEIKEKNPTLTAKKFRYRMKTASFNREFGRQRDRPGVLSYLLAALIKILPKTGPLAPLKFKAPLPQVEKLYIQSFDTVLQHYSGALQLLRQEELSLANKNLDTGLDTNPAEYALADETYCKLLSQLNERYPDPVSEPLKKNILRYFRAGFVSSRETRDERKELVKALDRLR